MKNARLLGPSALLCALAVAACDASAPALRLELPARVSALSADDAARLRATFEVPGLLAPSPLAISDDLSEASGSFTVDVDTPTKRPFTLRLSYATDDGGEVLLARLDGEIDITPAAENSVTLGGDDYDTCGALEPGGPCAPTFDRNRNGASNLEDLCAGIDPLPPPPFLDAAPAFLQFPSGIRLGDFARQVIVLENDSARHVEVKASLIDAPGVTLSLYETTARPETSAQRSLDLGTIAPFEQAFLAVSFAPVNAFLTVGDVYIEAYDPESRVRQATRVRIVANADGDLQPAPGLGAYAPAPLAEGADLGGFGGAVEPYHSDLLFSGLTNNQVQSLAYTGATLSAVFDDGSGGRRERIPADAVFLVEVPAEHKLSVSVGGLSSDVDLAVLLLDEGDAISDDPARNLRPQRSGPSPEAVEVRNPEATPQRALVVLGRVEAEAPPGVPGGLSADAPVPVELSAHVTRTPEFTAPPDPMRGPLEGGNRVRLTGRGFSPRAQVTFAGALALDCSHEPGDGEDISVLDCTAPAGSLLVGRNPATVVVENPSVDEGGDGQAASLVQGYVYEPPAPRLDELLPAVAPDSGSAGTITLRGAFFSRKNGPPEVRFGEVVSPDVTFVDSTRLEVVAPAHPSGVVAVTVRNVLDPQPGDAPDLVRTSLPSNVRNFTYVTPQGPAPSLADISPETASIDGGALLTLTGTGFVEGMGVLVGGEPAADVDVLSATQATAVTPTSDLAGSVDVEVVNPDGQRGLLDDAFTYVIPPPSVASVFPDEASSGGGTVVVVNGAGFRSGVEVRFLVGGEAFQAVNVNRVSTSTLLVATPAVAGGGDATLQVANVDGQTADYGAVFRFVSPQGPPPTIDLVEPAAAELGAPPATVVVRGEAFSDPTVLMGSTAVALSPLEAGESASEVIRFTPVEPATPGPVVVRVVNADGQSDSAVFTWFAPVRPTPRLEQVFPAEAAFDPTEPVLLSLRGTNLPIATDPDGPPGALMLDPGALLRFGPDLVPHASVEVTDFGALRFPLPDFDARVGDAPVTTIAITLTSPDGQIAGIDFRYLKGAAGEPPEILVVSPAAAQVGEEVTLVGSGFGASPLVQVGSALASVTSAGPESLAFTVPALPGVTLPAQVALRVTNPDVSLSATTSFTVLASGGVVGPAPSVGLVVPEVVHALVPGDELTVVGAGLLATTGASLETEGGAPLGAAPLLSQSDVALTVQVPVALDDTPDSGQRYRLRLAHPGGADVLSPPFEARRPRAFVLGGGDDEAFLLGEHLNPASLAEVRLSGPSGSFPLPVLAASETFLRFGQVYVELVPGVPYDLELQYRDPISNALLPPVVVTGGEMPPLVDEPIEVSLVDVVPAGSDLGGLVARGVTYQAIDRPEYGAPTTFTVVDAQGAPLASGIWTLSGCCDVDLFFDAGASLEPGFYDVRLATDVSPAVAASFHGSLEARPRRVIDVDPPTIGSGGSFDVSGDLFPGDVLAAENTLTAAVVVVPLSPFPACDGDWCTYTATDTTALTEGSWRLCAIDPDDPAPSCPDGPLLEVLGDACAGVIDLGGGGYVDLSLDRVVVNGPCYGTAPGRVVTVTFSQQVDLTVRAISDTPTPLSVSVTQGFCGGPGASPMVCGSPPQTLTVGPGTFDVLVQALDATGPVAVHLSATAVDVSSGLCLVPDTDTDGFTECDGDCNEGSGVAYPGNPEVCDGIDNDCDFAVDNLRTSCTVAGQTGACAVGREVCQGATPVCEQVIFPGVEPEICGDGVDNDCDTVVDELDCEVVSGVIPFAPESGPFATEILAGLDEGFYGPHPIGFPFEHFGRPVTDVYVSSNGFIAFDNTGAAPYPDELPLGGGVDGLIAAAWSDLAVPATSVIGLETRGTAPNRRLIVDFLSLEYCCGGPPVLTTQVILYEGSNHVEIHTTELLPRELTDVVQGVENACGSVAQFLPGRNREPFGLRNDAVRFVPVVPQGGGCGDCSCDVAGGETIDSCPVDCGGPSACGNGLCEPGERFGCPSDCLRDRCGNGLCEPAETSSSCLADCDADRCGNGTCETAVGESAFCVIDCGMQAPGCNHNGWCDVASSEDGTTCPGDCYCGDGLCGVDEDPGSCANDCYCGDGTCSPPTEDPATCASDCFCGDGTCSAPGEDPATCAVDCA